MLNKIIRIIMLLKFLAALRLPRIKNPRPQFAAHHQEFLGMSYQSTENEDDLKSSVLDICGAVLQLPKTEQINNISVRCSL